jgi:two-component system NtrC family sensor kinase
MEFARAHCATMRVRPNLQQKFLLLVTASMTLIVIASSYLHNSRVRSLIERDHYDNAVSQTLALGSRVGQFDYFSDIEDIQQEMQLVISSRRDFKQIDVYENRPAGPQLVATTAAGTTNLLAAWDTDNAMPAATSATEIHRNDGDFWLITAPIQNAQHSGMIKALVLRGLHRELVTRLHREYNLILIGGVIASVGLLYLIFVYFFRKPVKDIVQTMNDARHGDLTARTPVHRDDELGEIAAGFNQMMNEIATRSREREVLLREIGSLNNELVQRVNHATAELRAANGNLMRTQQRLSYAERMAAIGQVTASLAHEIGTPLNAMAGHLQLLARNHPRCIDTQRRLKIINSQLTSIVQSVKSLLERTHRRSLEPQLTRINEIVEEVLLLVSPLFESRNIRVTQWLDPQLPLVRADREGLHQVFLNLVNNSLDAMPDGGEMQFVTNYLSGESLVEVRIIDTGAGIPTEAREHLFEPMWTTKKSGSGLGLAIAREIVLEHGGEIDCIAEVERGAEFRVVLPAVAPLVAVSQFNEVSFDVA